jgi:hypothetical protein
MPTRPPGVLSQFLRDQHASLLGRLGRSAGPWMKARELDIILEALASLRPVRCLEWGAGGSTLYFPPRIPTLARWTTIEHHLPWFEWLRTQPLDPRVTLLSIPPDHGAYPDTRREGTYEDFRTYVDFVGTAVRRGVLAHRRHHDAVGKLDPAKLDRREEGAGHGFELR